MTDQPPADRHQRYRVMLAAQLTQADGVVSQHRVVNISETGVCLGQAAALVPGTVVVLAVGEVMATEADIVWVRDDTAGLSLRSPIDLEAARRRTPTTSAKPPSAGWMTDIGDAYRRR